MFYQLTITIQFKGSRSRLFNLKVCYTVQLCLISILCRFTNEVAYVGQVQIGLCGNFKTPQWSQTYFFFTLCCLVCIYFCISFKHILLNWSYFFIYEKKIYQKIFKHKKNQRSQFLLPLWHFAPLTLYRLYFQDKVEKVL